MSLEDSVTIDGIPLLSKTKFDYIIYHKPIGIETTTDTSKPDNIIDAIHYPIRIFPVGRLDKDSSGLIILTSDGQIVNRILRSENAHEKEYIVTVDQEITSEFLSQMSKGVEIYNPVKRQKNITLPAKVKQLSQNTFSIILTQGLNLQIRRMAKALNYHVMKLHRTRIMNLSLESLPKGKYRQLTSIELTDLLQMIDSK